MKHNQMNMDKLKRIFDAKQMLLAVALTLALPALILCQTNSKNADKKGGDEQSVRQTLDELAAALRNNDAAALDRIYADDYIFVGDAGSMMTKAERIAAFKSGDLKYESVSLDVKSIRLFGDTAVAISPFTTKVAPGGTFSDGKFITTSTFVKRKGRWQQIAAQSTRISE
ncbi:MAG: nuclear transport factor 2 family protein [Acidobacteriota bacterium]|nr:nuclear transport factor 2 family protein [Acidobacteriota bacterium]